MPFIDLSLQGVEIDLRISSKKQLLQHMAQSAAKLADLDARAVFEAVMDREHLGTTGVGSGVAIPHAHIEGLDHIMGVFARLTPGLDFESVDGHPVDLVFLLLAPVSAGADHLQALAHISRLLRKEEMRTALRQAPGVKALHALLSGHNSAP